jgi:hypothetical protein
MLDQVLEVKRHYDALVEEVDEDKACAACHVRQVAEMDVQRKHEKSMADEQVRKHAHPILTYSRDLVRRPDEANRLESSSS